MKYILLFFMLYLPNYFLVAKEKPIIKIVHDPFAIFYPHLGYSICRKKAFKIAFDTTIHNNNKILLWKKYQKSCSADGSYQLILADFYVRYRRNYDKANQILEKTMDNPEYDNRYHKSLLHDIYHDLNEKYKSMNLAKRIINDYPDWYRGYADLGLDFIEARNWIAAKQYLEKALEMYNQDPRTYLLLAYVLYELREDDKVLEYYHKAFLLDPYQPYLHFRSSVAAVVVYSDKGEFEAAKDILDHMQDFNPNIINNQKFIGLKQYYENALNNAQKIEQHDP